MVLRVLLSVLGLCSKVLVAEGQMGAFCQHSCPVPVSASSSTASLLATAEPIGAAGGESAMAFFKKGYKMLCSSCERSEKHVGKTVLQAPRSMRRCFRHQSRDTPATLGEYNTCLERQQLLVIANILADLEKPVDVIFLNFIKDFDAVSHSIFLDKLPSIRLDRNSR